MAEPSLQIGRHATVLVVGLTEDAAARFVDAIEGAGFTAALEPDPARATALLEETPVAAVIAAHPLSRGSLGSILTAMKERTSPNRGAGLILLASAETLRTARTLMGRGVTRVLPMDDDAAVLGVLLERLVVSGSGDVQRTPLRAPVTWGGSSEGRTEDVSRSGMLVAADDPPPVGARLPFALRLPRGEVEGELRVARHTTPSRDPVAGFGARFIRLRDDDLDRLVEWLEESAAS